MKSGANTGGVLFAKIDLIHGHRMLAKMPIFGA